MHRYKKSCMMATAAVSGLSTAGKRILSTSFYSSDLADKLFPIPDYGSAHTSGKTSVIVAKKLPHFGANVSADRHTKPVKALEERADTIAPPTSSDTWFERSGLLEENDPGLESSSLEVLIMLQKSMLEKQWSLSFNQMRTGVTPGENCQKTEVTSSGVSARKRRTSIRRNSNSYMGMLDEGRRLRSAVSPELLQARFGGYVRGTVSEDLLTHAEVVHLSKKIKTGLSLEEHKLKLKEEMGFEPSDKQLALSLRMSRAELRSKLIECSLAREKLAMSNVRLVMSIAQKYDNLGAEMADLIQGGLIGLLRGIEKFDSSKGFKISTYVYWWIRQGVSRALAENSRTLRLPTHLHERLISIRNAKTRLEERGIIPSVDKLAECLNISEKKVRNATEAVRRVISLDREAFPSLNGLPSDTLHSYIADNKLENIPWQGFEEWSVKDEVNKLLRATLGERERDIIRLYHGIDSECHKWEDISRQFGLSRERVRQVGLVALEKLKHAARRRRLEAMLVKH